MRRKIRQVTFEGDHFERGLQRGKLLRETLDVPPASGLTDEFVEACRDIVAQTFPEAIQELEGIIQGGGFDRKAMAAHYFARLESRLGGCTMLAVDGQHVEGVTGPLAGRNYDWAVEDLRWCELHWYLPPGGQRSVGYTHHWAGCTDLLNESGLYVAIASLPPAPVRAAGVQWNILIDAGTERCSTIGDAAALLGSVRHLRPMSYLLADASGQVGVVEATPDAVVLRRPKEGLVTAANAPQGGNAIKDWSVDRQGFSLSEPIRTVPQNYEGRAVQRARKRISRAEELLRRASGRVSVAAVQQVLSDHAAPICTGDHNHPDGAPWGTIWSGLCTAASREFWIAPGLPCRHPYQRFVL